MCYMEHIVLKYTVESILLVCVMSINVSIESFTKLARKIFYPIFRTNFLYKQKQ